MNSNGQIEKEKENTHKMQLKMKVTKTTVLKKTKELVVVQLANQRATPAGFEPALPKEMPNFYIHIGKHSRASR